MANKDAIRLVSNVEMPTKMEVTRKVGKWRDTESEGRRKREAEREREEEG